MIDITAQAFLFNFTASYFIYLYNYLELSSFWWWTIQMPDAPLSILLRNFYAIGSYFVSWIPKIQKWTERVRRINSTQLLEIWIHRILSEMADHFEWYDLEIDTGKLVALKFSPPPQIRWLTNEKFDSLIDDGCVSDATTSAFKTVPLSSILFLKCFKINEIENPMTHWKVHGKQRHGKGIVPECHNSINSLQTSECHRTHSIN